MAKARRWRVPVRCAAGHSRKAAARGTFATSTRRALAALAIIVLGGCVATGMSVFGSRWTPANRYPPETTKLPLEAPYTFLAMPVDGSLRGLLGRWAKDTGRGLRYGIDVDFTLYTPASTLRETDIQTAVARLNAMYAGKGIVVTATRRDIVVAAAASTPQITGTGAAPPAGKARVTPAPAAGPAPPSTQP